MAINHLKNKSSILKKNEEIMKKYSRSNIQKSEDNFIMRQSSLSNSHKSKNLKVKKGHYQRAMEGDTEKTYYSSESISSLKKGSMKGSHKIKSKGRQISNEHRHERSQGDNTHKSQSKSIGSQLMKYTNKSKRLTIKNDKCLIIKNIGKEKKKINNLTS